MKTRKPIIGLLSILMAVLLVSPLFAQSKSKGKAKASKVSGNIGLLDTEKNYMIVVTKDGKLVTIDYTDKTKVTAMKPSKGKIADIGLGTSAAVQYMKKGDKNYLSAIEFVAKKGR